MPRVVHFEINADNPERAVKFYEKSFGWKIQKWDGPMDYWLITTGDKEKPGIDGAIMKKANPQATIFNTIDVSSIDEYQKKVVDNGGKIIMPKDAVPGVGYFSYCTDTEGNTFGLMQYDPKAK